MAWCLLARVEYVWRYNVTNGDFNWIISEKFTKEKKEARRK